MKDHKHITHENSTRTDKSKLIFQPHLKTSEFQSFLEFLITYVKWEHFVQVS